MNENARRSTGDINTRSEKGEYRIPSRSPCTRRVASLTRASVKGVPRNPHEISQSNAPHGNPHHLAVMAGRVPLMGAGSRRALGDIGNTNATGQGGLPGGKGAVK